MYIHVPAHIHTHKQHTHTTYALVNDVGINCVYIRMYMGYHGEYIIQVVTASQDTPPPPDQIAYAIQEYIQ